MTWPANSRIEKQQILPCAASSIAQQQCREIQSRVAANTCVDGAGGKTAKAMKQTKRIKYPSHFEDFDWWKSGFYRKKKEYEEEKLKCIEERCPKSLDVPVPSMPRRYPYRYSSAAPSTAGRTQREWDMRRAYLKCFPQRYNKGRDSSSRVRDIMQAGGYETTTLSESLKPFQQITPKAARVPNLPIGKSLVEPTYAPWVATSEFDRYVTDTLHPGWHTDPLYRRRVVFKYYPAIPEGH